MAAGRRAERHTSVAANAERHAVVTDAGVGAAPENKCAVKPQKRPHRTFGGTKLVGADDELFELGACDVVG